MKITELFEASAERDKNLADMLQSTAKKIFDKVLKFEDDLIAGKNVWFDSYFDRKRVSVLFCRRRNKKKWGSFYINPMIVIYVGGTNMYNALINNKSAYLATIEHELSHFYRHKNNNNYMAKDEYQNNPKNKFIYKVAHGYNTNPEEFDAWYMEGMRLLDKKIEERPESLSSFTKFRHLCFKGGWYKYTNYDKKWIHKIDKRLYQTYLRLRKEHGLDVDGVSKLDEYRGRKIDEYHTRRGY